MINKKILITFALIFVLVLLLLNYYTILSFAPLIIPVLFWLIIIVGVVSWFYVRAQKKRASAINETNELKKNELKKSDEITKNGVVINATDETEEYSVKKCPYCTEEINKDAIKCKHCGEAVGKGYEIIADGTYVANKIQGEWTSGQSEVLVRHNRPMSGGQVFFRVVWITLLVIFIWVVVQLGACAAFFASLG